MEIAFAHRTFAWGSDARGKAHVHVVIIGLDPREAARAEKRLFSYPDINGEPQESRHAALSPYLFDAGGLADPHLTVRETSSPVNGLPKLVIGSKPIDGGHYIFTAEERDAFLVMEPDAAPLAAALYRRTRIPARRWTMDSCPARHIACKAVAVAARAGTHRRRPRLSTSQQKRTHPKAGGNADALSCERHPHRAVSRYPGSKL